MNVDQINTWAEWLVEALARASWHGAVAAAVVWTVCAVFRRMPGAMKAWLWRLVLVKFVLALVWFQPVEIALLPVNDPPITRLAAAEQPQSLPAEAIEPQPEADASAPMENLSAPRAQVNSAPAHVAASPSTPPFRWQLFAAATWGAGVLMSLLFLGVQFLQAARLRRNSKRSEDASHLLIALARAVDLVRLPALRISSAAKRPMLIGIWRPALVFPESIVASGSQDSLRMMIAHELAHIRRADLAWTALAALAQAVFFFHPLAWFARREMLLAQEIACDELAVKATAAPSARYAEMLVDVVAIPARCAPAMVSLGVAESRRTLERRIRSMKFFGYKRTRLARCAGLVIITVAIIALVPVRLVEAKEDPVATGDLRGETTQETHSVRRPEASSLLETLRGKSRAELREILSTVVNDRLLHDYLRALAEKEQEYAGLQHDYSAQHPNVVRVREVMAKINQQIEGRIDGILAGLQVQAAVGDAAEKAAATRPETEREQDATTPEFDSFPQGDSQPRGSIAVPARISGAVAKVFVKEGDFVTRGQALIQMDTSAVERRLRAAEARAKIAEADLQIAKAQLDETVQRYGIVKKQIEVGHAGTLELPNIDIAKANVAKAEAQKDLTEIERDGVADELKNYTLRAPRDGIVTFIIHEGAWVPEGSGKMLAEIGGETNDEERRRQVAESKIVFLEQQLARQSRSLKEGHPALRKLKEEIAAARAMLDRASERERIRLERRLDQLREQEKELLKAHTPESSIQARRIREAITSIEKGIEQTQTKSTNATDQ